MTLDQIRRNAALKLQQAGFESAALEARLLCEIAFSLNATQIIAKGNQQFNDKMVEALLKRRLTNEPIARIRGTQEFYGLNFNLNEATLIPRQDTECLVDASLALKPKSVLDLGTGTGAILVSILKNLPKSTGMGVDIAPKALEAARENVKMHNVKAEILLSNWFETVDDCFDLIISNPPYIAKEEQGTLTKDVLNHDPALALFADKGGLAVYELIFEKAAEYLNPKGHVIVEVGYTQAEAVEKIANTHRFGLVEGKKDLGGHVRALIFNIMPK